MALRGVSFSVLLLLLGRCLQRCYLACARVICMLGFSVASSGSSSGQRFVLPIMRAPSHVLVVLFSVRGLSSISPPSSPYWGLFFH